MSVPDTRYPEGRDLRWFYLGDNKHVFKPETKDFEAKYKQLGALPETFEAHVAVEQQVLSCIFRGDPIPDALKLSHPEWHDGLSEFLMMKNSIAALRAFTQPVGNARASVSEGHERNPAIVEANAGVLAARSMVQFFNFYEVELL